MSDEDIRREGVEEIMWVLTEKMHEHGLIPFVLVAIPWDSTRRDRPVVMPCMPVHPERMQDAFRMLSELPITLDNGKKGGK